VTGADGPPAGSRIPGSRAATAPERLLPRGRHHLPREFVARTQRDRLIDAMAQTVATKSYAGASLTDVCTTAGVSTKAFYEHFADKESCFLATFDRGAALVQKSLTRTYLQQGRWPERIQAGLATLLDLLACEPAFATLAVVEVLAAGPRALQRRQDLLASFKTFFADAPHHDHGPAVPDEVVAAVVAGIYGVIFEYVAEGRVDRLLDCLPELTYFSLVPFIGRRAAAEIAAGARLT
jgi:AcrR family transcriptional regulator